MSISPMFGQRKPEGTKPSRRPNLSTIISQFCDPESNPGSTKSSFKHHRQQSTAFQPIENQSRKTSAVKKPSISTKPIDFVKLNQLMSNRSSNVASLRQENKENIAPKEQVSVRNQFTQNIKRISSKSQHENALLSYLQTKTSKPATGHKETENTTPQASQSREISVEAQKKIKASIVTTDMDMLCNEKPKPYFQENSAFDEETIQHLYKRELLYQVNCNYEKIQPDITSTMRAVLIDWLIEVCQEYSLKRETLHLAVHNFDRFMSRKENIQKGQLQMYGIASLYMACKVEEIYPPKVMDFSQACNFGYDCKQILGAEQEICTVLKWFLNPPTLYLWSNWYLTQWDLYVNQNQLLGCKKDRITITFKTPNQKSYTLFRQYMNLLDCSILDLRTFQFANREIVATLIYLVTMKNYLGLAFSKLVETLNNKTFNKEYPVFRTIFSEYLNICYGMGLSQLNNCVRYMVGFLNLEHTVEQPSSSKIADEKDLEEHYEYFLSIQTHSVNNLGYIRNRLGK